MTEFIKRFTPLNFDNPINQDLVGYYPLNERSGPVAFDMSKNNNHGDLINDPTWAQSGRFGDVLDFDPASDQYVDCGTGLGNALGNSVSALSVSLWFKVDVTTSLDGLFYIGDFLGTQGEVALYINSDKIDFRLSNNSFAPTSSFTDTNLWHHIVAMYTGSSGQVYLDNVKIIDSPHSTNLNLSGLKTLVGISHSNSFGFDGKIDQVRIYNRVLQPAEIKTLFMSRP